MRFMQDMGWTWGRIRVNVSDWTLAHAGHKYQFGLKL